MPRLKSPVRGGSVNLKILKLLIPYIFIGAFTFQFAKQGLDYSSPYVFMGIRYLIAALILLLISRKLVFSRNIIPVALSFSASSLFWILGLEYVTPGDSAVLNYTMPLFAILGAVL
ncbi:MAG: EamA family transporter [Thaumarchaeota archaeon]|nr:EamA family transporter [Nitrososphaerota archaeon]